MSFKLYFPEAENLTPEEKVRHLGDFYGPCIKKIVKYLEEWPLSKNITPEELKSEQHNKDLTNSLAQSCIWDQIFQSIPIRFHHENTSGATGIWCLAASCIRVWWDYRLFILDNPKKSWGGFCVGLSKTDDVIIHLRRPEKEEIVVNKKKK